jgi:hypothetical protein
VVTNQCMTCAGGGPATCSACQGYGYHVRNLIRTRWDGSVEYYTEQVPCSSCARGKVRCPACDGSGQTQPQQVAGAGRPTGSFASAIPQTQPLGQVFLLRPGACEYHPQFLDTFPRSFNLQLRQDRTVLYLTLTPRGTKTWLDTSRLPRGQWYTPTEADGTPLPVQLHFDGTQLYVLWLGARE